MKNRLGVLLITMSLSLGLICGPVFAAEEGGGLSPGGDAAYVSQIINSLAGGDGLFHKGLDGIDIFDDLGYVYMGWRTTGGKWQNQIIGDFIMEELKKAGYQTTDAEVEAPYGSKPASDKSSETEGDYAWLIKYQETEDKKLKNTWDPEYAGLDVRMVTMQGQEEEDAEAKALAESIGGSWWGFNPMTEVYQKNFAQEFGMDYEHDLAPLESVSEKIRAMHAVLMRSEKTRDERTGVDDYSFVQRESIDKLNKEAVLNKRTRLAWESCFTDPSGTDPAEAAGSEGELLYVGEADPYENTNSEGIPNEKIRGNVILTDSKPYEGWAYAYQNGGIGVATISSLESFLHPKDENGRILEPWYDSSRYARGSTMDTRDWLKIPEDVAIVEWQFSRKQYDNAKELLNRAEQKGCKVMARQIAIGQMYPMTKTQGSPGQGQAVAIAEVKGSVHPEKRVLICAHVQEPGCGDNATGVATLLEMATKYRQLIAEGLIERPKCTVTFMWGDELNMGDFWMDGHQEEMSGLIGALDLDMVGEDPKKTGGVMRIEKMPDPSADYRYSRDEVPWNEPDPNVPSPLNPAYGKYYEDQSGDFVRLPDSHTFWGKTHVSGVFRDGWYLNDLYRYSASSVSALHDPDFRFQVCPYEGGSDHTTFLERGVPALLTWHFTDYNYHTSSDTLYMASPREMENVGITTLAVAQMMSDACVNEAAATEVLGTVREAALQRMDVEKVNTDHHLVYVKAGYTSYENALKEEKEILNAWGTWYGQALDSVAEMMDQPTAQLEAAVLQAKAEVDQKTQECLAYAEQVLKETPEPEPASIRGAKVVLSESKFAFNGKVQKPEIRSVGGKKLKEGRDYVVKWSNASSKSVGAYSLTVTGIGQYKDSTKASYQIDPKGTGILKLVKGKKALTVKWQKQAAKMASSRITGYQVQVAANKAFTKGRKTVTVKGYQKVSRKVSGLQSGKRYYVRVRTFKTVKGMQFVSAWSKIRSVKAR